MILNIKKAGTYDFIVKRGVVQVHKLIDPQPKHGVLWERVLFSVFGVIEAIDIDVVELDIATQGVFHERKL